MATTGIIFHLSLFQPAPIRTTQHRQRPDHDGTSHPSRPDQDQHRYRSGPTRADKDGASQRAGGEREGEGSSRVDEDEGEREAPHREEAGGVAGVGGGDRRLDDALARSHLESERRGLQGWRQWG
eukprot:851925-Rhodomonas_salina.1